MPILEAKNIKISINKHRILNDVSFSVDQGQALAIIGPNGSGKTTLLRAVLGAIKFEGEIIKDPNLKIGYVPQKLDIDRNLPITASEFLKLADVSGEKSAYSINKSLDLVGLDVAIKNKSISVLSSGEFQRLMIAIAIRNHPNLLIFDEPTASVDVAGQDTVYELLHKLQIEHNISLILISHDLSVVYKYANKVLCLNHNQICYGIPKEVLTTEELNKLYGTDVNYYHHHR